MTALGRSDAAGRLLEPAPASAAPRPGTLPSAGLGLTFVPLRTDGSNENAPDRDAADDASVPQNAEYGCLNCTCAEPKGAPSIERALLRSSRRERMVTHPVT